MIVSDSITNDVIDLLYGNDVLQWVAANCKKVAYTEVGGPVGKNMYGRITFNPSKVNPDKDQDPSQFQESVDTNKKKISEEELSKYQENFNSTSTSLGLKDNKLYDGAGGGSKINDDIPNRSSSNIGSGGGASYAPIGSKSKSKSGGLASFNS